MGERRVGAQEPTGVGMRHDLEPASHRSVQFQCSPMHVPQKETLRHKRKGRREVGEAHGLGEKPTRIPASLPLHCL
jgi:hypothetical protein